MDIVNLSNHIVFSFVKKINIILSFVPTIKIIILVNIL